MQTSKRGKKSSTVRRRRWIDEMEMNEKWLGPRKWSSFISKSQLLVRGGHSVAEEKRKRTDRFGLMLFLTLRRYFFVCPEDISGVLSHHQMAQWDIFFLFFVLLVLIYSPCGYSSLIGAVHLSSASLGERQLMSRHTGHTHATVVRLTESFSRDAMWSDWWSEWAIKGKWQARFSVVILRRGFRARRQSPFLGPVQCRDLLLWHATGLQK